MRIKTWVEFSQEVDVEIDIDDVMAAIADLPEDESKKAVANAICIVHEVLREIHDRHIAAMTSQQRELIYEALIKQADRYRGSQ